MRTLSVILLALPLLWVHPCSAFDSTYAEAQEAYDAGDYEKSAALYESLLNAGAANPEVHYNLANASFKLNQLPTAVWHYRKAWYSAPRDPDIRANLHFALAATGAVEPAPGISERVYTLLPLKSWIATAIVAYLLLSVLLLLSLLVPSGRIILLRLSLIPILLLLLSGGGWYYWHRLALHPEWVVIRNDATALFGPIKGSTAHYKLPLGALTRQRKANAKGWVEIEYDGKQGWIQEEYIKRISP